MIEAVLERCAGLDVHQETVVACVLSGDLRAAPKKELRTYGTTTEELIALAHWLTDCGCSQVAMESTGVYWKPIWNVLEAFDFEMLLANAHHIKNLPGRKTDMKDAEWIAKLLRSGLIEGSFVPSPEVRDLRDLTRYRKKLVYHATAEKNRMHRLLQDANIKLTTFMSDVFGVSGRRLLQRLVDGEVITREFLHDNMQGPLKHKTDQLLHALNGRMRPHHIHLMRLSWEHLRFLEQTIQAIDQEIASRLQEQREAVDLLVTIPGINEQAASIIIAEIGTDMEQFTNAHALAAWAGVCPGNFESAGKKKRTRVRSGNSILKAILCECAWAAVRTRNTRLSARYWSLVKRMGKKKALVAIAHTLLKIIYHVLYKRQSYIELGAEYLDQYRKKKQARLETKLIRDLEAKGFVITKPA